MKKSATQDLQKKSVKELVKLRQETRKSLFDLRLKNSLRSLNQTHLIRNARRTIAKINTYITQKIGA